MSEPAFPQIVTIPPGQFDPFFGRKAEVTEIHVFQGMSIRDYFAGQALPGFLAMYSDENTSNPAPDHAAREAVRYADALIAELSKPTPTTKPNA